MTELTIVLTIVVMGVCVWLPWMPWLPWGPWRLPRPKFNIVLRRTTKVRTPPAVRRARAANRQAQQAHLRGRRAFRR